MIFRAADGVLVVADGREVQVDSDGEIHWRSDHARKVSRALHDQPVVGAAIGLASVGRNEDERDMLDLIDDVIQGPRPAFGVASGDGPWTAKALASEVRRRADKKMEELALGDDEVIAAFVGWPADASEPSLYLLELTTIRVAESDANSTKAPPSEEAYASGMREVSVLQTIGFVVLPETSSVWMALRPAFDASWELLDQEDVDEDDPRFWNPFKYASLNVDSLIPVVEGAIAELCETDSDTFAKAQVGGNWSFVTLKAGQAPQVGVRSLGPHHATPS